MNRRGTIEEFVAACRAGDEMRAARCFTHDAAFREPGRDVVAGDAAIREHFGKFFRHGPEWRWDVDDVIEGAGDRWTVVYRFAMKGNDGEWNGQDGCALVTFAGDTIAEWREYRG